MSVLLVRVIVSCPPARAKPKSTLNRSRQTPFIIGSGGVSNIPDRPDIMVDTGGRERFTRKSEQTIRENTSSCCANLEVRWQNVTVQLFSWRVYSPRPPYSVLYVSHSKCVVFGIYRSFYLVPPYLLDLRRTQQRWPSAPWSPLRSSLGASVYCTAELGGCLEGPPFRIIDYKKTKENSRGRTINFLERHFPRIGDRDTG